MNRTSPPNPFPQLAINRCAEVLRRLELLAWGKPKEVSVSAADPSAEWDHVPPTGPFRSVTPPEEWGQLYNRRWFRVDLPKNPNGDFFLRWQDESQACAWYEGRPYWGFDYAHRNMRIPKEGGELLLEAVCMPPFIGQGHSLSPSGSKFQGAWVVEKYYDAWKALQRLRVLYDMAMEERFAVHPELGRVPKQFGHQPPLSESRPIYRQVLRQLDACANAFDRGGVSQLTERLDAAYSALQGGGNCRVKCSLVGHAHIDLVWLWPERVGELKARHTFSSVLRLMEEYPEFRFLYSQAASYRAVERVSPELIREVGQRIQTGQWEAAGALEVESDTLIACGEALLRSFLLGQEKFRELTGKGSKVLWLPDVFGYSGCLPQLMQACGVDYFFTTKLSWNALNRFPYSTFRWRGLDGAEVIAHVTQNIGYNGETRLDEIREGERSHQQSAIHPEFLAPTGHGDGGGGPTSEMCERARALADLADLPKVGWSSAEAFFDRAAAHRDELPVYDGELYFEYHRGTYTTQARIKELFRSAERGLQTLEAAHCAVGLGPIESKLWQRMVFAQFHDYIPGSSVLEVNLEAEKELQSLADHAINSTRKLLETPAESHQLVFNPLPLPIRVATGKNKIAWIPPLTGCNPALAAKEVGDVQVQDNALANDHVQAHFSDEGELAALVIDGEKVRVSGSEFMLYPDHPAAFQAWEIDRQTLDNGAKVTGVCERNKSLSEDGTGTLSFSRSIGTGSSIQLNYLLRPGSRVIEAEVVVDWCEPNALLRWEFPTDYLGRMARFGAPFGSVLRPQRSGDPVAEAMWEVPGSRYAIAMDDAGKEGFFLVTECKYGFSCRNGRLGVSLLRSPRYTGAPGEDHSFMMPPQLMRHKDIPLFTDLGVHRIRLAFGRFSHALGRNDHPAALAETLFTKPIPYHGRPVESPFSGLVGGESLVPSWAVPIGEKRFLVRLHEVMGCSGKAKLNLRANVCCYRSDVTGSEPSLEKVGDELVFRAYEIISIVLKY